MKIKKHFLIILILGVFSFASLADQLIAIPDQQRWTYDPSHSIGVVHSFKYRVDPDTFIGLTCNQRTREIFTYVQKGDKAYKSLDMKKFIGYHSPTDTYQDLILLPTTFKYMDLVFMFGQYDRILIGNGDLIVGFENPHRDAANELWLFREVCGDGILLLR